MNQKTRKTALERDSHECQLSKLFGIAHLSGVPCIKELEVHHITYERFNEEEESDLIVVCQRCHEFLTSYIRGLRYSIRNGKLIPEDVMGGELLMATQERIRNEDLELPNYGRQPTNNAQWFTRRPSVRGDKVNLEDFPQAAKDRGRLRRDGET